MAISPQLGLIYIYIYSCPSKIGHQNHCFQTGMRPNQSSYNFNYMDFIHRMYSINNDDLIIIEHPNNQSAPYDSLGICVIRISSQDLCRVSINKYEFYLCSWAMCKILSSQSISENLVYINESSDS